MRKKNEKDLEWTKIFNTSSIVFYVSLWNFKLFSNKLARNGNKINKYTMKKKYNSEVRRERAKQDNNNIFKKEQSIKYCIDLEI